jgi:hypothetical protein
LNEIPLEKADSVKEESTDEIPERPRSDSKAGSGPNGGENLAGVA